jgi:MFS family permease
VLMAGAGLLFASRANALAEAAAPAGSRGRYLAAFQYAFTVPGVIAPAVVALFGVAVWLPWLLVAACAGLAVVALRVVARHLPAHARHVPAHGLRPPVARQLPERCRSGSEAAKALMT